jgi:hypothetical protein
MAPILTTQDLKDKYSFKFDSSKEEYFAGLIEAATNACQQYMERDIGATSYTQYTNGGSNVIVLDHTPVLSVQGVVVSGSALGSDGYRLESDTGVLTLYRSSIPVGLDIVKIQYSAGWEVVPEDVKYCVALTVQYLAKIIQSNQAGVQSRTVEGGQETLEQNIPPMAVKTHLSIYRRNRAR